MIQCVSHASVYVLDQDRAKDFYIEKLGFELRADVTMGPFRWLTVAPKGQPDFELILMPLKPTPMMDEATCNAIRELFQKGVLGAGVFATAECRKTYEELEARGVEFVHPPMERPYGIEDLVKDDSGNWFSMTQRRALEDVVDVASTPTQPCSGSSSSPSSLCGVSGTMTQRSGGEP